MAHIEAAAITYVMISAVYRIAYPRFWRKKAEKTALKNGKFFVCDEPPSSAPCQDQVVEMDDNRRLFPSSSCEERFEGEGYPKAGVNSM